MIQTAQGFYDEALPETNLTKYSAGANRRPQGSNMIDFPQMQNHTLNMLQSREIPGTASIKANSKMNDDQYSQ